MEHETPNVAKRRPRKMSFASNRVAQLEAAYNKAAATGVTGLVRVNVDGQDVEFSTLDALYQEYVRWKSRAARENRTRPRVAQINLRGAW